MNKGAQVYLVDDDDDIRFHLTDLLHLLNYSVSAFGNAAEFLMGAPPIAPAVLVLDMRMPVMNGLDVQQALKSQGWGLPIVFISGESQSQEIIDAMKGGAIDFLWKPFTHTQLVEVIEKGLNLGEQHDKKRKLAKRVETLYVALSRREKSIFALMLLGYGNKDIAAKVGLMPDTVKKYRAQVLEKMQVENLPALLDFCKGFELPAEID